MSSPQYSTARPAGREHFPLLPQGFIALRIVQLVLAVIVLGLSAYSISLLSYDGNQLILAVAVLTFIVEIYYIVAHFAAPVIYNYWATLGLDIFFIIMWLSAFALQAARVSSWFSIYNKYVDYYSYYYGESVSGTPTQKGWLDTQAAAAALGGIEFVLFIIALVLHSIGLHRHRAAGLHCMPAPGPVTTIITTTAPAGAATQLPPYGSEKTAPAPAYAPQQPAYALPQQQQQAYLPQQRQQAYPPQQQQQAYPPQQPQAYPPQQPQQGYYPPQQQQQQQHAAAGVPPQPPQSPVPTAQSPVPTAQSPVPTHSVVSEAPTAEHNHGYVGGPVPTQLE